VKTLFSKFGKKNILDFFQEHGLNCYSDAGKIFPITNQAATVVKIFQIWLDKSNVEITLNFEVKSVRVCDGGFEIAGVDGRKIKCRKVIFASGGRCYPALGSNKSLYDVAAQLGHTLIEPIPSAVPLVTKDIFCHLLQGQKVFAKIKCIEAKQACSSSGDLLFTKYGLSGTAILDISEYVSIALNRHRKMEVFIEVDLLPFITEEDLRLEFNHKLQRGFSFQDLTVGMLPNKFTGALKQILDTNVINNLIAVLKHKTFRITATRGWNEAEFTCGGIKTDEVNPETLESKLKKGLFFCGEILDVNGQRGGYNLAWAWASGFVSGESAAKA
jgi:predicted Rossmann fold flavoprotein